MESGKENKSPHFTRRVKKKKGKNELDRSKQAEKKMKRLEKALATSAAIRSELEMKKQKRMEEQQRLEKDAAAIAEAVALHVLHGEDSEESYQIALNQEEELNLLNCTYSGYLTGRRRHFIPYQIHANFAVEEMRWESENCGSLGNWSGGNNEWSVSHDPHKSNPHALYFNRGWDTMDYAADLIGAQIVSSLHISDSGEVDTLLVNGMLRE